MSSTTISESTALHFREYDTSLFRDMEKWRRHVFGQEHISIMPEFFSLRELSGSSSWHGAGVD
jgi:hypothetical protein